MSGPQALASGTEREARARGRSDAALVVAEREPQHCPSSSFSYALVQDPPVAEARVSPAPICMNVVPPVGPNSARRQNQGSATEESGMLDRSRRNNNLKEINGDGLMGYLE